MTRQAQIQAKAQEAVLPADQVVRRLLLIAASNASPEDILEEAYRLYRAWPLLCRLMAELQELCPNSAGQGIEHAQQVAEAANG